MARPVEKAVLHITLRHYRSAGFNRAGPEQVCFSVSLRAAARAEFQ